MKIITKRNAWRLVALAAVLLNTPNTNGATLTVTSTADSGPGTLRDALASAADNDTIDATGVSGTILLTSGELLVTKSLAILGSGPADLAVDGNASSRVFHIGSNAVVTITGLTITNGLATSPTLIPWAMGGGIYSERATLTVSNCILSGNLSTNSSFFGGSGQFYGDGGAIYNDHGNLMVNHCVLSGNQSGSGSGSGNYGGHGGGIFNGGLNGGATAIIANSTLKGNIANSFGAGIYDEEGTVVVTRSTLSGNSNFFNGGGGGIGTYYGTITVSNCAITGNAGGGVSVSGGTLTMATSTLSGNSANYGGGIETEGPATIVNCTFNGNSALYLGGGILNYGTLTIDSSTLSSNSAANPVGADGGGIENEGTLTIANSTLSGNSALHGGGIFNEGRFNSNAVVKLSNTILDAGGSGMNITNDLGTITSLGYNLSSGDGGGLLNATGDQINTDPMLSPLQDNGGPTLTHALLPGSPAIDKGFNFSGSTSDQRGAGFVRTVDDPSIPNAPGGDGTDVGAYEVQTVSTPLDSDGDGVPDAIDQCPDTPYGAIVNANGCSIDQLVPCDGPQSGGSWKNHGQYVRAIIQAANEFLQAGLINHRQWSQIVSSAAQSRCGWNPHSDHGRD